MTGRPRRLAGALAVLALAACTGHGAAATSEALVPQEPGDLAGTAWTLIGTGEARAVPASARAVVRFAGARVVAAGACRSLRLSFTDAGDARHGVTATGSTLLCSVGSNTVSAVYERALLRVDTAELESGSLNLTGPHDLRLVLDPRNHAARDLVRGDL